jgi:hypothetical protein
VCSGMLPSFRRANDKVTSENEVLSAFQHLKCFRTDKERHVQRACSGHGMNCMDGHAVPLINIVIVVFANRTQLGQMTRNRPIKRTVI